MCPALQEFSNHIGKNIELFYAPDMNTGATHRLIYILKSS